MSKRLRQNGANGDLDGFYLSSHLRPPQYSIGLVERPRLIAALDGSAERRLVLVHAPAGFGKTTVLYQWISRLKTTSAIVSWLSAGQEDVDPYRFVYHLQCAIATANGNSFPLDSLADRSFQERSLQADVDKLLALLVSDKSRLVLVIDDYHLAESETNNRILDEVVKSLRPPATLVISSRARPALSLPYFKCQGLLESLDAVSLRFSQTECSELFAGADLEAVAEDIFHQSGGWPMALQLAKLWLRERNCAIGQPGMIDADAAGITEYLSGEILKQLPDEVSGMITDTSILERVNGDIANYVTGRSDCWSLIGNLDSLDALIAPIGGKGGWFRYHQLFRETLQGRLARCGRERITDLNLRASEWFEDHGDIEQAAAHASQAGSPSRVAAIIESAGAVRIGLTRGMPVLRRVLQHLSAKEIYAHPRLHLARIWLLAKQGKVEIARRQYDQYMDGREDGPGNTLKPCSHTEKESLFVGLMLTEVYEDKDFGQAGIERIESMAQDASAVDHWFQGWVNNLLCVMYTRKGNLRNAMAVTDQAMFHYRQVGSDYGQVWMLLHGALVSLLDGRLRKAAESIVKASRQASAEFASDRGLISIVRIVESVVLLEQNRIGRASEQIFDALKAAEKAEGWVEIFVQGYGASIELAYLHDGFEGASQEIDRAQQIARSRRLPRLGQAITLLKIEVLTIDGRLNEAEQLARRHRLSVESDPDLGADGWRDRVRKAIVLSRLAIYAGEGARAAKTLAEYLADAERHRRRRAVMELALMLAMAEHELGRKEQCVGSLRKALHLAVTEGYRQVFAREGKLMARMVGSVVRQSGVSSMSEGTVTFLARLITRVKNPSGLAPSNRTSGILTAKELAVLDESARGNANKVIARNLEISVATVKFHLSNIYRKLGVGNRTMAVAVAREKNIL